MLMTVLKGEKLYHCGVKMGEKLIFPLTFLQKRAILIG